MVAAFLACAACTDNVEVGADRPTLAVAGASGSTTVDSGLSDSTFSGAGAGGSQGTCEPAQCPGGARACSDCIDTDSDTLIDGDDPDCLGPCQGAEDTFFVSTPNLNRCSQDCYFDDDSGFGNDQCSWAHHCDPHGIEPAFDPHGENCAYAPEEPIQGPSTSTCSDALASQSDACLEICLPLTPPGCDCFGCCVFPETPGPVWIGSNDGSQATCTRDSVADPALCRPCMQVPSCLNSPN